MMQSQQIPMTFQRYETKYMLSPIMARKLRKSLPGHLQMDEYGLDTICSLYYDTQMCIRDSSYTIRAGIEVAEKQNADALSLIHI